MAIAAPPTPAEPATDRRHQAGHEPSWAPGAGAPAACVDWLDVRDDGELSDVAEFLACP